jgi:hypothetical protein
MDTAWFMWSSLFALIGFAAFAYGRRQQRGAPTLIGIVLMLYPYFVSNTLTLVGIGAFLIGALFVGSRIEGNL